LARLGFNAKETPAISHMLRDLDRNQELFLDYTITDLKSLVGQPGEYLIYEGSSTEPPCEKEVLWVLISDVKSLSQSQLDQFPTRLLNQYRSTQPRMNREIRISFAD